MSSPKPCHLCGGRDFSFGKVYAHASIAFFVVDGRGMGDVLKGDKKSNLRARVCVNCKNVQFFAPHIDEDDRTDPATLYQ